MHTKFRKIVIVGGGSAGWMAAAAFAKAMTGGSFSIDLIESEEIGTVGVGEATIPSILEFNRSVGLDEVEFIRATQASFKLGIEFVDWRRAGHAYMHPFGFYGVQMEGIYFHHFWLRHHAQGGTLPYDAFCSNIIAARAGKFGRPLPADRSPVPHLAYAYHFDAGLYAAFLRKFAEARGVKRHEGKVVHVQLRATDGFIESVKLQDGRVIDGDLFIDCSGFRGLLIEQSLQAGYEDWSGYLPCDRAMAVPCERVADTTPYTRSTAREAGWQWRIPLQHRTGNGYVYCSEFMSEDEAASLLLSRLDGKALNTPRPLRFVTGRRKEIWKKNCVALGLASGFLEPLESTSSHLVLASIQRLLFMFPGDGFDQATIDKFNTLSRIETEEIRDFLVLHYTATERNDTPFWRHCQAIRRPPTLEQRLEMFERSANIVIGAGELFREPSWFAVLMGQSTWPKSHHPFANNIPDDELTRRLELMSGDVVRRVQTYPMHDEFIRTHCAAPPVPIAEPAT
jgi:tryptophan halogenase